MDTIQNFSNKIPQSGNMSIYKRRNSNENFTKETKYAVLVKNAEKNYGTVKILQNFFMGVKKGEIYALLGPSGCGKTTLLSCIIGLRKLDSGSISLFGYKPNSKEAGVPGNRIGYVPQQISLFDEFSINEALWYFGRICCKETDDVDYQIEFLIGLLNLPGKHGLIRTLSEGQKRRVSLAAALIHEPDLLILDEPTVGIDALLRESLWQHLANLAEKNTTIIITTHYIDEANSANKIGIMRNGRLLENSPNNLLSKFNELTLQNIVIKLCKMEEKLEINDEEKQLENYKNIFSFEILKSESEPWKNGTTKFQRIKALTIRNFLKIWRNIPFVTFFILVPALATILYGIAVGGDLRDINFGFVNNEMGYKNCDFVKTDYDYCVVDNISCKFIHEFKSKTINLIEYKDEKSALEAIQKGESWGYFEFSSNFTDLVAKKFLGIGTLTQEKQIKISLDMTNQIITGSVTRAFLKNLDKFFNNLTELCLNENYKNFEDNLIEIKDPVYGSLNKSFTEYSMPSFLIVITFSMSLTLSSLTLILEKKEGMLERSLVAGVTKTELILSHLVSQYAMLILQLIFVLVFTFYVQNLAIIGSLWAVILLIILQGTIGMWLGFVLSTICSDESSIMQMVMGITVPLILLSGMIWPLEGMPKYIQYLCIATPPTLPSEAIRSIINRGWSINHSGVYQAFISSFLWIAALIIIFIFNNKFSK